MNITEAFPGSYIKTADLRGRRVTVTMSHVEMEDIDGEKTKPVLYFQGTPRGLVLNKTNANYIVEMYGPETEAWRGRKITIYPTRVDLRGSLVDAIRVQLETPGGQDLQGPLHDVPAEPAAPRPATPRGTPLAQNGASNGYAAAKSGAPMTDDEIPF